MKKWFPVIFSFLILTSLTAQTSDKYPDVDELIIKNTVSDALTALNKLESTYQKDTLDPEYWLRYSKASYNFYRYADAKKAIKRAILLDPSHADYYFEMGIMHNTRGELDEALVTLDDAISVEPKGEYYYWRGIVNQQLGKLDAAQKDYQSAIEHHTEYPELYNNLSILQAEAKNYETALVSINRAIELDGKYAQAYSARSKIQFFLFNFDAACVDRYTAIKMGYTQTMPIPDSVCLGTSVQQYQFAAELMAVSKLYTSSIAAFTWLIDQGELYSNYFLNRGYCFFQLEDYSNAEKDYLKALTLPNPSADLLYDNLSLLYYEQHKFEKTITYSSKRIELDPKNPVPYLDRGLAYRKLKKYKAAEKDFNKSLELKPDFFRAFAYKAALYMDLNLPEKALADADMSVQLNPAYGYGYLVVADAKQALGSTDFCADLQKALELGQPEAKAVIEEKCAKNH